MKISVDVDCTPDELRGFFGLPDVKPMQEQLLKEVEERMRAAEALGLTLFAEVPSNTLTAVTVPAAIDGGAVMKTMEQRYGVKIAGGQNQLKGKIFRLGHIGYYDEGDILRMVGAFESALIDHGWKAEPGTALKAAQASYRGAGKPAGAPVS